MKISVIIPTYNRSTSLKQTLISLSEQEFSSDEFEVIVADDGSIDKTSEIIKIDLPYSIRHYYQDNQGSAAARNLGAQNSYGEILVLLDDDIRVTPSYLSFIYDAHQVHDSAIIQGCLMIKMPHPPSAFQQIYINQINSNQLPGGSIEQLTYLDCLSGFLTVKRPHYFKIGQMQDIGGDGRTAWGDVDFGYRAYRHGFDILRVGEAIGYHDDSSFTDFWGFATRWQEASHTLVKLIHRYPELANQIPMIVDKNPIDWISDSPQLITRKVSRQLSASSPISMLIEKVTRIAENNISSPTVLKHLYRWVAGNYVYEGYQAGIREYGDI